MEALPSLVRFLLGIPGLALRTRWLEAQLAERPFEQLARDLADLCETAERLEPEAREAQIAVVALLARCGRAPWVKRLRTYAFEATQPSLMRLLRVYALPSAFDDEAEGPRATKTASGLTLGERKSLARRPDRRSFERLLADPHPHVIRHLLLNPHLTENDVVKIAALRPGRSSTIEVIAEFPTWLTRPMIRLAIVFNPLSPSHVTVPLLALATRPELEEIASSPSLHVVLRATAREWLERRPPLGPADTLTLQ